MPCIICGVDEPDAPLEHIVPESMGNQFYTLTKGNLCKAHNNIFSEFEGKALTKTILGMERARIGVKTKKGRPAISKTGEIQFTGDDSFRKNVIRVTGLTPHDIKDFDPLTGTFKITVQGFDKTEVATAKLMLKIGLEAMSESRKEVFNKYDLKEAKQYLDKKSNTDWPFLITKTRLTKFVSIPRFNTKYRLKQIRCELLISEIDSKTLLFNFVYQGVSIVTNLAGRGIDWVKPYIDSGGNTELYPVHLRKKIRT
jgi:hypothetical protein